MRLERKKCGPTRATGSAPASLDFNTRAAHGCTSRKHKEATLNTRANVDLGDWPQAALLFDIRARLIGQIGCVCAGASRTATEQRRSAERTEALVSTILPGFFQWGMTQHVFLFLFFFFFLQYGMTRIPQWSVKYYQAPLT